MTRTTRDTEAPSIGDDAPHLLIIDDDSRIRSLLKRYLGEHGFRITAAADAAEARRKMQGMRYDCLILDVMMPGESGMEFIAALRDDAENLSRTVPVMMLTARAEADSRIRGLELGVDDYLAKPFEPRELLLRLNNILKRGQAAAEPPVEMIRFGDFTYHLARGELRARGVPVRLTERERELMTLFATRANDTVPRTDLANDDATSERTVDVQINRLRRKIENDPTNPLHLQTIRGVGYRLLVD